jgi:acyl-coenzyme A synthetase/AMP-(fatty) acid ligase
VYLGNEAKTREVMRRDEDGVLWMHTGDEALLDKDGFAQITGRIKDMIIRGKSCLSLFLAAISEVLINLYRRGEYLPTGNRRTHYVAPSYQ